MKILLAIDSFKGCLSTFEAEEAAASVLVGDEVIRVPVSDGGEGFTDCWVECFGGSYRECRAKDPIGREITTRYGLLDKGKTAVIETAAASGITLLSSAERDPVKASSFGTGQLIQDAINQGVERIYIGLGGSATVDGGVGLLQAVTSLPDGLEIHAFYDTDIPFYGPSGAACIYGPQKGADPAAVALLDRRLENLGKELSRQYGKDIQTIPGAGAAGGIGGALALILGAGMHRGIRTFLEWTGFRKKVEGAALVITGEGKADSQTVTGKVPSGVLKAVKAWAPEAQVWLMAGKIEDRDSLLAHVFDRLIQTTPENAMSGNYLDKQFAVSCIQRSLSRELQDFRNQQ